MKKEEPNKLAIPFADVIGGHLDNNKYGCAYVNRQLKAIV